ncbi:two-component system response regulator [Methyloceanibacter methanicus]|uniref:Two-component system response regulator n=1 Tax=Methyloceanibacter methanicus TaxID=1774968 RepID=A0A1E3W4S1_9HYPH|nr:response regulator [Methyloceanibacter methanicus]ODS00818.1 two-component system response regulator [Methyloceanibacter methanicus]
MALDFNMPVLVVDDYRMMLRIIRNFLRQLGFEDVDGASDGRAALEMMHERDYGLVISDWDMAPMTGYDLLREVRRDGGLARTPFIMVTANDTSEDRAAAKHAGVSNYILKPFNAVTLRSKIDALFDGRP